MIYYKLSLNFFNLQYVVYFFKFLFNNNYNSRLKKIKKCFTTGLKVDVIHKPPYISLKYYIVLLSIMH